MTFLRVLLATTIALVICDAALEIGLTVHTYLFLKHGLAVLQFSYEGQIHYLNPRPMHIEDAQLFMSLAAGAAGIVITGFGGLAALRMTGRDDFSTSRPQKAIYYMLQLLGIFMALFVLVTIVLGVALTSQSTFNYFEASTAAILDKNYVPGGNILPDPYIFGYWTTETWYEALLNYAATQYLSEATILRQQLPYFKAWRLNLIPLLVLCSLVPVLAVSEQCYARRKSYQALQGSRQRDGFVYDREVNVIA